MSQTRKDLFVLVANQWMAAKLTHFFYAGHENDGEVVSSDNKAYVGAEW